MEIVRLIDASRGAPYPDIVEYVDADGHLWHAALVASIESQSVGAGGSAGSFQVVQPTIVASDTPAYTAGDSLGGKITLLNVTRSAGDSVRLESVTLTDDSNQKPTGTLLFFNSDPTAATITDNVAFAYSTDFSKQIASVPVVTGDWVTVGGKAIATLGNLNRMLQPVGTSLFVAFVLTNTPDLVTANDVQIRFGFARD